MSGFGKVSSESGVAGKTIENPLAAVLDMTKNELVLEAFEAPFALREDGIAYFPTDEEDATANYVGHLFCIPGLEFFSGQGDARWAQVSTKQSKDKEIKDNNVIHWTSGFWVMTTQTEILGRTVQEVFTGRIGEQTRVTEEGNLSLAASAPERATNAARAITVIAQALIAQVYSHAPEGVDVISSRSTKDMVVLSAMKRYGTLLKDSSVCSETLMFPQFEFLAKTRIVGGASTVRKGRVQGRARRTTANVGGSVTVTKDLMSMLKNAGGNPPGV